MARFKDHEKALDLRKQGMSYSQIKKILHISKSTLSCWLRKYPLTKKRIRELRDKNEVRIERFRETMRHKKEKRLDSIYKHQKREILPLNKRDLFIGGLFLYWGEGSKSRMTDLTISNTDPAMIKFFIKWLSVCFKVSRTKLNVQLQLYGDMDIDKEIKFWSNILCLSRKQFIRPYVKKTLLRRVNHRGGFGHGTCNVRVGDVRLSENVLMGLKAVSDKYNKMRV